MNKQIVMVVGGIAVVAVLYNVFFNKQQFPCNCPKCQEVAVIDAINKEAALIQLGQEQSGPAFVKVLVSIVVLFVVAGMLAVVAKYSQQGIRRVRKRVGRLPYGKRFGL